MDKMLLAVVGGNLQGVEAAYLAQKAGWRVLVIDKNPHAPATGFCDQFIEFEFTAEQRVLPCCPAVDCILPAVENITVLTALVAWAERDNIPLAFDINAYRISCSKLKSNELFSRLNLPMPRLWPACGFPVVVKPDQASGSHGVKIFADEEEFLDTYGAEQKHKNLVVQEYIEGPSYSLEIIGVPGRYQTLQVTDLSMDEVYDCKRVTAPTKLSASLVQRFERIAVTIAAEIKLKGIMDVEVVLNEEELKILEIDARFPSQTPMAVYWSSGKNMVELLCHLSPKTKEEKERENKERFVIIEHISVVGDVFGVYGERIMAEKGPLIVRQDFYGADEAITSYAPGKEKWVSTMIFYADSRENVLKKRDGCYRKIQRLLQGSYKDQLG